MINFEMIYNFYNTKVNNKRLWDIDKVKKAVELRVITPEQFKQITSENYIPIHE